MWRNFDPIPFASQRSESNDQLENELKEKLPEIMRRMNIAYIQLARDLEEKETPIQRLLQTKLNDALKRNSDLDDKSESAAEEIDESMPELIDEE